MPRSSTPAANIPLGSLTQHGARGDATCAACGSDRVTQLAMTLTDGTPVEFVSCHRCEHKTWRDVGSSLESAGAIDDLPHGLGRELERDSVLDKARKLTAE